MAKKSSVHTNPTVAIRAIALSYPETTEGIVCNRSSFKARGKAFVFMGVEENDYDVMLKLDASLKEATELERKQPDQYHVGGHNWVTAIFARNDPPPAGLLERWMEGSFQLLAPKSLLAKLPRSDESREVSKPKKPTTKRR
jgi:hypothetical protein